MPPVSRDCSESTSCWQPLWIAGEGWKCQYDFIGDKSQRSPGNRDVTAISPFNIRGNVAFAKSSAGLAQKSAQKTGSRFLDLEQKQERATVVWKVSGLGNRPSCVQQNSCWFGIQGWMAGRARQTPDRDPFLFLLKSGPAIGVCVLHSLEDLGQLLSERVAQTQTGRDSEAGAVEQPPSLLRFSVKV